MLNALSLTRGALTWTWPGSVNSKRAHQELGTGHGAYARGLRQARHPPLANLGRGVDRRDVGVLDERLADEVHREPLRLLDVRRRVLAAAVGELRDGDGDERRRLRDLVEQTGRGGGGGRERVRDTGSALRDSSVGTA